MPGQEKNTESLTFEKVWQMFQETDKKFQETRDLMDRLEKEADKRSKKLSEQIGGLGNKFGKYNEDLFKSSLSRILDQKFGCKESIPNYKFRENGNRYEIDLFGVSKDAFYLVEIKTSLKDTDIKQLKKIIDNFKKHSALFDGRPIYGIICATWYKDVIMQKVIDNGYYFISASNQIARLIVPLNFQPKKW
jgi:hypothetical protein